LVNEHYVPERGKILRSSNLKRIAFIYREEQYNKSEEKDSLASKIDVVPDLDIISIDLPHCP